MMKLCAVTCVIGWGFFYAFTYLAIASVKDASWMPVTYAVLAFGGFVAGMLGWVRVVQGRAPRSRPVAVHAHRRPDYMREIA